MEKNTQILDRCTMTSDREKCGISSLLPMSCRGRAEAFARSLQSKLTSLGSEESNGETSWLGGGSDTSVTFSQPRAPDLHHLENDFLAFDSNGIESPGSPIDCEDLVSRGHENGFGITVEIDDEDETISIEIAEAERTALEIDADDCECNGAEDVPDGALLSVEPPGEQHDLGEEEDTEERTPRVRRCSSLKTGKTPPGTPSSKKIVRFADVLGLDLADVRTFLDDIPKVPTSAYKDLSASEFLSSSESSVQDLFEPKTVAAVSEKLLMPLFQQPGGQPDFLDRLRQGNVCLDNALVEDMFTIKGYVRVRNLDFHKSVHVRYTLDSWRSFADSQALYIDNSCDGFSDKFSFILYANNISIGQQLEFAIRFQCKGCQYWDNNYGVNYIIQCLPSNSSSTSNMICTDEKCAASFYY